ncbi:MAG: hypothetical protein AAF334_07300 [Pseudomonadota bacterium]
MIGIRTSIALAAALAVLTGCAGVRGASDFSKRQAFAASFQQIPLVEDPVADDRLLNMYVFTDEGITPGGVRNGYKVKFSASVYR